MIKKIGNADIDEFIKQNREKTAPYSSSKKNAKHRKSTHATVEYHADIEWDEEASVWIVTSNDIIGLVMEDESMDALIHKVQDAVPELLELNGQPPVSRIKCSVKSRQLVYS